MKKIGLVLCGCLLTVVFAFYSLPAEATVLIKHKEINGENIHALIPVISGGPDRAAQDEINARLDDFTQENLKAFREVLAKADLPAGHRERISFYAGYTVRYNKYNLLSITVEGYNYTGGAHGMSWKHSLTADLKSGRLYALPDLFHPLSNYKNVLDDCINKQIKERGWEKDVSFPGVDANTRFYLTGEMLAVYCQPYEIAPYSLGMPEFYIPVADIESMFANGFAVKKI